MANQTSVLFLCERNSARSQMAEAFLRRLGSDRVSVQSAGLLSTSIHPLTLQVMNEIGYDLDGQRSKSAQLFLGKATFDYVITVCEVAQRDCPRLFPGALRHLFWPFDDPVAIVGAEEVRLRGFRAVRDAIHDRIVEWLPTLGVDEPPARPLASH